MRWKVWVLTALLVGCDSESGGGDTDPGSTSSTSSGGEESSSSGGSTGGSSSTSSATTQNPFPGTTTTPPTTDSNGEVGDSSTGEPLPEGPSCSVQVTTHGLLTDPLPRGDTEGVFPPVVADALEDWCGCHTLESNNQNVEHTGLLAPGGTLFMTFEDISRPSGGGTLGDAFETAVVEYSMPPGSCSFPSDAQTLLEAWFAQGFPDGANFEPPMK